MSKGNDYIERPSSELLVDLHVYMVPPDLWREHLHSAVDQIINETVSAGFIRVLPETTIYALREELENQLGYDAVPRDYVFLKSVGRCLTRVRPKQEFQLKVKNFLPPQAYSPEIYVIEATPEVRATFPPSGASSERSDSRVLPNSGGYSQRQPPSDPYRPDKSEFSPHKTIPPIRNGHYGYTIGTQTGDVPLPPLSATPPNSPTPPKVETQRHTYRDEYLPPLSATPPRSPEQPRAKQRKPAEDPELERRRMEELLRQQQEEVENRRRELEEMERKRREWEEQEKHRREEEERQRREEEEKRRREQDEGKSREEERLRREKEEERRKREEDKRKREEEDRRRRDEEEKRRREEEERKRREEEERKRREMEEDERKRREEEERKKREQEEEERRRKKKKVPTATLR